VRGSYGKPKLLRIEAWRPNGHTDSDPFSFKVSEFEKFAVGTNSKNDDDAPRTDGSAGHHLNGVMLRIL
jgi:hypothetical protein